VRRNTKQKQSKAKYEAKAKQKRSKSEEKAKQKRSKSEAKALQLRQLWIAAQVRNSSSKQVCAKIALQK
jgi:hypothetical protein